MQPLSTYCVIDGVGAEHECKLVALKSIIRNRDRQEIHQNDKTEHPFHRHRKLILKQEINTIIINGLLWASLLLADF